MQLTDVTTDSFDTTVLTADRPVLVDFWRRGAARARR
jgi:thioredoxin 1